jgi:hypothetical protein
MKTLGDIAEARRLIEQGYTCCVYVACPYGDKVIGDVISLHRDYEDAAKAARGNDLLGVQFLAHLKARTDYERRYYVACIEGELDAYGVRKDYYAKQVCLSVDRGVIFDASIGVDAPYALNSDGSLNDWLGNELEISKADFERLQAYLSECADYN